MYEPKLGRFLSADPYRLSGYLVDPQSWNRYVYCRNDAVNSVDPNGLEDWPNWTMKVNGVSLSPEASQVQGNLSSSEIANSSIATENGGSGGEVETGAGLDFDILDLILGFFSEEWKNELNDCEKPETLLKTFPEVERMAPEKTP